MKLNLNLFFFTIIFCFFYEICLGFITKENQKVYQNYNAEFDDDRQLPEIIKGNSLEVLNSLSKSEKNDFILDDTPSKNNDSIINNSKPLICTLFNDIDCLNPRKSTKMKSSLEKFTIDNEDLGVWKGWVFTYPFTDRNQSNTTMALNYVIISEEKIKYSEDADENNTFFKINLKYMNWPCINNEFICSTTQYLENFKSTSEFSNLNTFVENLLLSLPENYRKIENCLVYEVKEPLKRIVASEMLCLQNIQDLKQVQNAINFGFNQAYKNINITNDVELLCENERFFEVKVKAGEEKVLQVLISIRKNGLMFPVNDESFINYKFIEKDENSLTCKIQYNPIINYDLFKNIGTQHCCLSFHAKNPENKKKAEYIICFLEKFRCFLTKNIFIKRFLTSCNNYHNDHSGKNIKLEENCEKTKIRQNDQLKSVFNEVKFIKSKGVWEGYTYFLNLGILERNQLMPYKISVHMGDFKVFNLPEKTTGKEEMVFLIKIEDFQLDHNGDSIYPISYFLKNFWRFYKNEEQIANFALANQQIEYIRQYYPPGIDIDRFCIIAKVLVDKHYLICALNEIDLDHLTNAFTIGVEKINAYSIIDIPKAYDEEEFKIAYFTGAIDINIVNVRFSKYYLLNSIQNKPWLPYSDLILDNNQCHLIKNYISLPDQITDLTSSDCCFQLFSNGNVINVCILRKNCMFRTLIFIKTLNNGCVETKRGGLILKKIPLKPKIFEVIQNDDYRILVKKKSYLYPKRDTTQSFCTTLDSFCEKMKIVDFENMNYKKEPIEFTVKIEKNQLYFGVNKKFQKSLPLSKIIKIEKFDPITSNNDFIKNLLNIKNSETCIKIILDSNNRVLSRILCSESQILKKFSENLKNKLNVFPIQNKKLIDDNVKSQKENNKLASNSYNVKIAIGGKSQNFQRGQLILQNNEILNSNKQLVMRYDKIKNCEFCYHPIHIKKGECCFKFNYDEKESIVCASEEEKQQSCSSSMRVLLNSMFDKCKRFSLINSVQKPRSCKEIENKNKTQLKDQLVVKNINSQKASKSEDIKKIENPEKKIEKKNNNLILQKERNYHNLENRNENLKPINLKKLQKENFLKNITEVNNTKNNLKDLVMQNFSKNIDEVNNTKNKVKKNGLMKSQIPKDLAKSHSKIEIFKPKSLFDIPKQNQIYPNLSKKNQTYPNLSKQTVKEVELNKELLVNKVKNICQNYLNHKQFEIIKKLKKGDKTLGIANSVITRIDDNRIIIKIQPNIEINLFRDGSFNLKTDDEVIDYIQSGFLKVRMKRTNKEIVVQTDIQIPKFELDSSLKNDNFKKTLKIKIKL